MVTSIDQFRQALRQETTQLAVDLSADVIRGRARRLRRRRAAVTSVGVLAVAALMVPITVAGASSTDRSATTAGSAAPSGCPAGAVKPLGELIDTRATLVASGKRYGVLIGFVGSVDAPGFVVAFQDLSTGTVENWDTTFPGRAEDGDLIGTVYVERSPDGPVRAWGDAEQFLSLQLALGPDRVLDVGLYTRTADRLTVSSNGRATDAEMAWNRPTGWTIFWAERTATPLPSHDGATNGAYRGPEVVTLTAYDAAGRPQHTVTGGPHVGHQVQNPRDHQPLGGTTPGEEALFCPAR